jgi:predicted nucleotidyltransferase
MFGQYLSNSMNAAPLSFGELLRQGRDAKGATLREVAERLSVDTSLVSKWERGERKPEREQVKALAKFLKADAKALLTAWLRDKVLYEVGDDALALDALKAAETQVGYMPLTRPQASKVVGMLKTLLAAETRIRKAWLFGSYARNESTHASDIDLMVEFDPARRISLFDVMGIAHDLSEAIGRKVDLVEKGMLKDFAATSAEHDMIRIHG